MLRASTIVGGTGQIPERVWRSLWNRIWRPVDWQYIQADLSLADHVDAQAREAVTNRLRSLLRGVELQMLKDCWAVTPPDGNL